MQYASILSLCYIPRPRERILNNKILSSEQAQELLLRKTWLQKVLFSAQEHTQHPEVRTVRTIHCIQCETNQNVTSGKTCWGYCIDQLCDWPVRFEVTDSVWDGRRWATGGSSPGMRLSTAASAFSFVSGALTVERKGQEKEVRCCSGKPVKACFHKSQASCRAQLISATDDRACVFKANKQGGAVIISSYK